MTLTPKCHVVMTGPPSIPQASRSFVRDHTVDPPCMYSATHPWRMRLSRWRWKSTSQVALSRRFRPGVALRPIPPSGRQRSSSIICWSQYIHFLSLPVAASILLAPPCRASSSAIFRSSPNRLATRALRASSRWAIFTIGVASLLVFTSCSVVS